MLDTNKPPAGPPSLTELRQASARSALAKPGRVHRCSGIGRGQLHAPPASLRGKKRPLENDVLENGPFQPRLRAPEAVSRMQAHRRSRGLSASVLRQHTRVHKCGARSSALGRTLPRRWT